MRYNRARRLWRRNVLKHWTTDVFWVDNVCFSNILLILDFNDSFISVYDYDNVVKVGKSFYCSCVIVVHYIPCRFGDIIHYIKLSLVLNLDSGDRIWEKGMSKFLDLGFLLKIWLFDYDIGSITKLQKLYIYTRIILNIISAYMK